jgi:phosphoribosylaminoimidazole carboxylase PurE protein
MDKPVVGIVMGSLSDRAVMEEVASVLKELGIPHEMTITSAHRAPDQTREYARMAADRGLQVIIAGAGGAAHLAGVIASETTLPVIGVPLDATPLHGIDALLATVQMPAGVPVATMAVGKAGARNASFFAAQVVALTDPGLRKKLQDHKETMARQVATATQKLSEHIEE